MGFKLLEVQENSEFPELFAAFRAGFTNPGTILWPLFTGDRSSPAFSKDATDIESEAVKAEYIGRFIAWHRADPTSTWLKVVDEDTGRVVGGGRWTFYESDRPYGEPGAGHKVEATWWPEGTERELASECLGQFLESAVVNMNKPHACMLLPFVSLASMKNKLNVVSSQHPLYASRISRERGSSTRDEMGSRTCG